MIGTYDVVRTRGRSDAAHDILGELPEWFGLEKFTDEYEEAARKFPNYLAVNTRFTGDAGPGEGVVDGTRVPIDDVTGILLLDPRYDSTAEVHLLAVRRKLHRTGIGRALLRRAEDDMRARGVRLLTVKTFGPSSPDPGYEQTRAFYEAVGFLPVEEFPDMWVENPCLLMAKVL
ncbi:GNAT family N-acetyltransferase [Myceligenerans pegani]|uniref:GNAT family N-acetyltransferase n=1 Tax=Myceligenerans pegani TaxID=2776917 RepID=A0ABR9N4M0_9MICO|nr:GNAT family N-acetyltransferase [Myceligenerans sp. TRM 65318]MBE1878611.1 GNAT family N-acetyltransferase [Myceligenerans sp. TRM 65318]MBE3020882.1 GNAT family N-acetyltransferase [Myceligenerans sp. TRM 65318]